ncbi:hypothetical protein [Chromobacterium amazonense]|uniref:hypothetical protein n=1 Tax=Chromobacterium amazonense TaxID=1382803 RepID=UPI0011B260EF|nr:hypothetical protein [Chromobacterium amazonense]
MITPTRVNAFGDADEVSMDGTDDLSNLLQRNSRIKPSPEIIDAVAEKNNFPSRDANKLQKVISNPLGNDSVKRKKKEKIIRSEQLNVRITTNHAEKFDAIVENLGVLRQVAMERMIDSYFEKLDIDTNI